MFYQTLRIFSDCVIRNSKPMSEYCFKEIFKTLVEIYLCRVVNIVDMNLYSVVTKQNMILNPVFSAYSVSNAFEANWSISEFYFFYYLVLYYYFFL